MKKTWLYGHQRRQTPDRYLSPEPGRTAWSRHIYQQGAEEAHGSNPLLRDARRTRSSNRVVSGDDLAAPSQRHRRARACRTHCGPRQVSMNSRRPTASLGGSVSRARADLAATCVSARSLSRQCGPSSDSLATTCAGDPWPPRSNRTRSYVGSLAAGRGTSGRHLEGGNQLWPKQRAAQLGRCIRTTPGCLTATGVTR